MSAFIVSTAHIDTMLTVAIQLTRRPGSSGVYCRQIAGYIDPMNASEYGQILHDANVKSVNYRYQDSAHISRQTEDEYTYKRRGGCDVLHDILDTRIRNIAQAFKAVQCYEYQSCEHPDWETSDAKWFCESLRGELMRALPGYEAADWEIAA
jgi:hypothetical protein